MRKIWECRVFDHEGKMGQSQLARASVSLLLQEWHRQFKNLVEIIGYARVSVIAWTDVLCS